MSPTVTVAALARSGASAEEKIEAALERIARLDGRLGAFVQVEAERARADARRLDARARTGAPPGPLNGVPVAVKDVIDIAGVPTRAGSLTRDREPPATRTAPVVERLEAAGAVVVGKTRTVEFAFGGWGANAVAGTPLNPWDPTTPRTPGGSSSGSGVAVAAGLVPLALGTDTGGSVRLPASFAGAVGLKTTPGLVEGAGVLPLAAPLDTVGPLTRTVADAALALAAMADPGRLRGGALGQVAAGEAPPVAGVRVGVLRDLGAPLHPATRRVYEQTLGVLEDAGAEIVWIDLGRPLAAFAAENGQFLAVEAYMRYGHLAEEEPNRLDPAVRRRILAGRAITAPAFLATMIGRDTARRRIVETFERVDAILTPTTATPALPLGEHPEDESPAAFTRFVNFLDLAAVSVPAGLSDEGLPVGLQAVVPPFHEPRALALAAFLEAAAGGPLLCPSAADS